MDYDYIKLGDCLELMPELPDKSIDMVLCDLPYGVLNKSNKSASWDCQIDTSALWQQYNRVVKDSGVIVLFGQGAFTAKIIMSNPDMWKYNLVWDKCRTTGFLNAKKQPLRCHEDIMVFHKGRDSIYNPQMWKCRPHQRNHSRGHCDTQTNRCYGSFGKAKDIITNEKYPQSIIAIPVEHERGKFYHPTQKPVSLLGYLIMTYTNEGDIVLDNCIGSGSTAIAAIRTNRHYIGYELTEEYYQIAIARINAEKSKTSLFTDNP